MQIDLSLSVKKCIQMIPFDFKDPELLKLIYNRSNYYRMSMEQLLDVTSKSTENYQDDFILAYLNRYVFEDIDKAVVYYKRGFKILKEENNNDALMRCASWRYMDDIMSDRLPDSEYHIEYPERNLFNCP